MKYSIFSALFVLLACSCNQQYSTGESTYNTRCANCHMEDGTGLGANIPPLAKSDYLQSTDAQTLACLIRKGISVPMTVNGIEYTTPMEGLPDLSAAEVANVINYIQTRWAKDKPHVSSSEVREAWAICAPQ